MSPLIRSIPGLLLLCSGFDVRAQFTVEPQLLSFGDQQAGTQSSPMSVVVRNDTMSLLFLRHVASLHPAFAAVSNCSGFPDFIVLIPRGSCAIEYTFSPPTAGPYSGSATVRETAIFDVVTIRLTGNGTGVAEIPDVVHADGFEAPSETSRW